MDGREKILQAALRRFAADGVAGTTLSALRRDSGVSVGSFYHHFADKAEVVAALYAESLPDYQRGFLRELHADPRAAVTAAVVHHVLWCGQNEDRARLLFTERPPADIPGNREFLHAVLTWWRGQARHGALRVLSPPMIYALWLGPAQELCRMWLAGRAPYPAGDEITLLGEAAWQALRGDA